MTKVIAMLAKVLRSFGVASMRLGLERRRTPRRTYLGGYASGRQKALSPLASGRTIGIAKALSDGVVHTVPISLRCIPGIVMNLSDGETHMNLSDVLRFKLSLAASCVRDRAQY